MNTELFEAIKFGDINKVKELIANKYNNRRKLNYIINDNQWYPIHIACRYEQYEILKLLIDSGCNIECRDYWKQRPIHFACEYGYLEIAKLLIESGCNIDCFDYKNRYPIHTACLNKKFKLVKLLIDAGCPVNILECCDIHNLRPIHYVCRKGNLEIVKLLILNGCNCDNINNNIKIHNNSIQTINQYRSIFYSLG
jgi:ankyrin repeat protein